MAVEKGKYKDMDEGISRTIDFYLNVLDSLTKQQEFVIYVQPVAPVLNETREVVKVFNKTLKEKVLKTPSLRFLDILDSLLTADKKGLNPLYEMDGTHMGPEYCKLIETSLQALAWSPNNETHYESGMRVGLPGFWTASSQHCCDSNRQPVGGSCVQLRRGQRGRRVLLRVP
eukprot:CAMPEP_0169474520 /NCGR_PEP_ID=MMETSP1042-20121227/26302_1 /TAXON_ID=464988 /ORGANISM="Hemiselmis andersenii, Strain CCMP1180" /LENGTH=171 /DNA_ID=CAMNT_0009588559 /DNA_START=85 /DNA_END=597 /DNA_ORIENTATION=+